MPGALSGIDHTLIDIFFNLVSENKQILYIICMT